MTYFKYSTIAIFASYSPSTKTFTKLALKERLNLLTQEYIEDCNWGLSALTTLLKYQHTYGISDLGKKIINERLLYLTNLRSLKIQEL